MAFNFLKWIMRKDDTEEQTTGTEVTVGDFLDADVSASLTGLEIYLCRMAFWAIIRKIGAAVAAVEWETYRRGKKVKAREYWSWNYAPNPNQTKEEFFQALVGQLFEHQEALIVETHNGHRYVAEAFSKTERLAGDVYQNISVNGEMVPGVYQAEDVLHLTIEGERIRRILLAIASAEGQLIKSTAKSYIRGQGARGVLHIDDTAEADPDFEDTYSDLVNDKFKKYFTSPDAVLPMFKGYDFQEAESKGGSSKANLVGTRDIRNLMDDIIDLTAQALGVPASIGTGKNVTDADFRTFLTSSVRPIVEMLAGEINRKVYGRELVYAGTYIAPNYANVQYRDLFDVAGPIDKLIGSGAFSVNDIRMRLGFDEIDEPWARQHWMTRNYATADEAMEGQGTAESNPATEPEKEEDDDEQDDE